MPPSFKFTRQEIINTALDLVRAQGIDALTARSLGEKLGASTKPIFGLFQSMEEVRQEVIAAANKLYESYIFGDMSKGLYPPYKASGMAYIRFAREEKTLFKLLFMCDRSNQPIPTDREGLKPILSVMQENLQISQDLAYELHLEMWIFVHGIATMIATNFLAWDDEYISRSLSNIYDGARLRCKEAAYASH